MRACACVCVCVHLPVRVNARSPGPPRPARTKRTQRCRQHHGTRPGICPGVLWMWIACAVFLLSQPSYTFRLEGRQARGGHPGRRGQARCPEQALTRHSRWAPEGAGRAGNLSSYSSAGTTAPPKIHKPAGGGVKGGSAAFRTLLGARACDLLTQRPLGNGLDSYHDM